MLWICMLLSVFLSVNAYSNEDVPHPEFGFEPGVIFLAIPRNSDSMSLAAIHLSVGEPVHGTNPGKFNQDLRREGNFYRGSVAYQWKTGDVIYYWVYVVVDGLGYQKLNQQYVITSSNAPSQPIHPASQGVYQRRPFRIPTPKFHFAPQTITVTIPAAPDVTLVAIHFSLNAPVPGVTAGRFNQDLERSGEVFVGVFVVPDWKPGDVIYYWVYVVHKGLGKHDLNKSFIIPAKNGDSLPDKVFVPPNTPSSTPLSPYLSTSCGRRPAFDLVHSLEDSSLFVHGGTPATDGEYPWQAQLLRLSDTGDYGHLCGGIIISDRHVLTAAHCVAELTEQRLQVVVGQYDRRTSNDPGQQTFYVQHLQRHRNYQPDRVVGYANDIAILLLRPIAGAGIQFGDYVQPICLPSDGDQLDEHTACAVSGWGRRDGSRIFPDLLHGGMVPYVTPSYCASEEVWGRLYNSTTHLCAGFTAGGENAVDACEGDSGGPLACRDEEGNWRAAGIVSWGSPECDALPVYVGVYTRVSSYLSWIVRTLDYLCDGRYPCP